MTDLNEADANDNLRQPVRYLLQIGVALILRVARRCSGALHRAWDAEQKPDDPAHEGGGASYSEGRAEGTPPNAVRNLRDVDESNDNADAA